MSMNALASFYDEVVQLAPLLRTSTPSATSTDLANVTENMFTVVCGALTDGTFTPKLQDSADNSTFADVAAADIVGTALVALTANTRQSVSYIGSKRYVKFVVTVTGSPSTGANVEAHATVKYRKQP